MKQDPKPIKFGFVGETLKYWREIVSLFDRMMESVRIKYDGDLAFAKTDDIQVFLGEQESKVERLEKELMNLKRDKSVSPSGNYIDVTFEVPAEHIEIEGAKVLHDKETHDTPESFDVTHEFITVDGCNFDINCYDVSQIDKLAIQRWVAS